MKKLVVCAILMLCLLPALMTGQSKPPQDVWELLQLFVGQWEGTGEGKPGVSCGSLTAARDFPAQPNRYGAQPVVIEVPFENHGFLQRTMFQSQDLDSAI